MAGADHFDWDSWKRDFDCLPLEVQEPLKQWYALQAAIVEHLGLDEPSWYDHISWALQNPGDFSFIEELSRGIGVDQGDGRDEEDPTQAACSRMIGVERHKTPVLDGGPGIRSGGSVGGLSRELFGRMVAHQMRPRRRGA